MTTRLFVLLFLALSGPAGATVLVPADFRDVVNGSTAIVHGRIVDVRSESSADRRTVATFVTVDVEQSLKGNFGRSVVFRVPGGEIGRYRRILVGAPRFDPGDEVVVFLASRGPSIPYLFGLSQGVYRVSRASGSPMVTPPAVMAKGAGAERVVRGDPARRPMPLDLFAREVRAIAGGAQ